MADTTTTFFDLIKPEVDDPGGEDLWGPKMTSNFDTIDGAFAETGGSYKTSYLGPTEHLPFGIITSAIPPEFEVDWLPFTWGANLGFNDGGVVFSSGSVSGKYVDITVDEDTFVEWTLTIYKDINFSSDVDAEYWFYSRMYNMTEDEAVPGMSDYRRFPDSEDYKGFVKGLESSGSCLLMPGNTYRIEIATPKSDGAPDMYFLAIQMPSSPLPSDAEKSMLSMIFRGI